MRILEARVPYLFEWKYFHKQSARPGEFLYIAYLKPEMQVELG